VADVLLSYNRQSGTAASRRILQQYLAASYQESHRDRPPQQHSDYLSHFVDQFLGDDHWVWWASCQKQPVGCLWQGYTTDPIDGDRYPYVFLLYVLPEHRRQGIGRTLMSQAESWAKQQGYSKLALHVFCDNEAGQQFYQQLSYRPQSTLMEKTL